MNLNAPRHRKSSHVDSASDEMLAMSYMENAPGCQLAWTRTYVGSSVTPSGDPYHEGRGVVAVHADTGGLSIYVTGVLNRSGEGRQFATWRYKE